MENPYIQLLDKSCSGQSQSLISYAGVSSMAGYPSQMGVIVTMRHRILTTFIAGTAVTALAVATPAQAKPATGTSRANGVQGQIDEQLTAYGGVQTAPDTVSYQRGHVKVVFPASGAPATCPSGWYCFFQYKDFGGRVLQFQDCGSSQSLEDYGFKNKTSSWDNRTGNTVTVYNRDTNPWTTLWTESPHSASSFVGAAVDNKADLFYTACAARSPR